MLSCLPRVSHLKREQQFPFPRRRETRPFSRLWLLSLDAKPHRGWVNKWLELGNIT